MAKIHFPLWPALALMCVLNFESCALVRQRTKQERTDFEVSATQRKIKALSFCDSLASRLNIVFDSVEIVVGDSLSPQVKVKATKATISGETHHTVTGCELAVSMDTISAKSSVEKVDERIVEPSKKPPWWMWLAGIAAVAVVMTVCFKRLK